MPQLVKQSFGQKWGGILLLVLVTAGLLSQTQLARDVMSGWGYEASATVAEIRDELELTSYGKRVFAAVHPMVEASADFNQHCSKLNAETNVLGCYMPGDDRVYVYEVTREDLKVSNKSTMAHELLHAVWERLRDSDKRYVGELLEQEYAKHQDTLGEILDYYETTDRLTELFARVGTELEEVSPELERYYARVFTDRSKIVAYYREYAKPLAELREKVDTLKTEILAVKLEITSEREDYEKQLAELDAKIQKFNNCASQPGCFTTTTFNSERRILEQRQIEIEEMRTELNSKITQNNERIQQFNKYQEELGLMNDAMDSTAVVEK